MNGSAKMNRRIFLVRSAAGLMTVSLSRGSLAADPVKIGLILPKTGPFASTGKQIEAACRLYVQKNGDTVSGRKVELLVKDDTGVAPELTKRIAQELVVREHASVIAGFGLTPLAFATAPIATEAKVPMIVMGAATSVIPQRSPYIVRSNFTVPQITAPMADWAAKKGMKRLFTMVTDYAPGLECEHVFVKVFTAAGGK